MTRKKAGHKEPRRNQTRRNETRRNETRRNETRRNEMVCMFELLEPRQLLSTTNDPYLGDQYALTNTGVTTAWNTTTGSVTTVVADIDTGADYTHQDLYENIWINQ